MMDPETILIHIYNLLPLFRNYSLEKSHIHLLGPIAYDKLFHCQLQ